MTRLKLSVTLALLAALLILPSCSNMRGAKLFAPERFGLSKLDDDVYIETGADAASKERLRKAVRQARAEIRRTYGSVQSHPVVNACLTEECYASFGGMGSKAKVYGDRILLSPRGLNWHYLAHEWSHTEMSERLSFPAWCRLPQWFDEGLAVAVSQAPDHAEAHWQFLTESGVRRPTREELLSYTSLRKWLDGVRRFGATRNNERRAKGEPEIHPVYAAAGHEVRPWLRRAGTKGLLELIAKLNDGEDFEDVYPVRGPQAD